MKDLDTKEIIEVFKSLNEVYNCIEEFCEQDKICFAKTIDRLNNLKLVTRDVKDSLIGDYSRYKAIRKTVL